MNGSNGVGEAAPSASGLLPSTYANAFVRGPPREGMQRIQTRLHKAKILTDELADYFAARRELENNYLKSLQKIAKRSFLSDPSALGSNFLPVYERLIAEIGEMASVHGELERKLEVECEVPMRNASSTGEWAKIKEHDEGLSSTLKEVNSLEGQLAKDQKKVEGASSKKAGQASQKAAETERSLKQTLEVWETEAPFAFEAYQRIDAQRLELMKEVVTKFETARSDAAQRLMASTEQSMQVVLNFDPQADMQDFALRNGTARGGAAAATTTTPARKTVTPSYTSAPQIPPPSGLSRKGSMGASNFLGRNTSNNAAPPSTATQGNGVNEFGGLGQSSSASVHSADRSTEQSTPSRTTGGSTLKSALTRFGRGRSNRNTNDTQTVYGSLSEGPESSGMQPPSSAAKSKQGSGGMMEERRSYESRSDSGPFASGMTTAAAGAAGLAGGAALGGSLMTPMAPTRMGSGNTPSMATVAPRVDADGFSIPPPDRKPWEDNAPISSPGLMDDEDRETVSEMAPAKMTGMSIAQRPIAEDSDQEQAAMDKMRSTLLTARSPVTAPQRRNTASRRDRRDVRNTTYNPSMNLDDGGNNSRISSFGLPRASSPAAAASSSSQTAFTGLPGTATERSQSMVSSGSMSQMGNISVDPALTSTGLNASITERVNVVFSGGSISKIMVVGEVLVSAKDLSSRKPLHLRIESFEQLEKAAPNPVYLKSLEGSMAKAGEYLLDVDAISATAGGRATLLKYQVFLSPNRWKEYAPLNITTQWRCEDQQTSILINYSANPESKSSSTAATIQDISIAVDVTSPSVSNIMSKPTATYSSEQKKLFWKLPESVALIGQGQTPIINKALTRFQVDQKSEIRPVEVRWKLPGATLSTLGLSIVDVDSGVTFNEISRQTTAGKYMASP